MADAPTFFFSHARQDRETPGNYLRKFFDDLEIKLAQWAGINLEEQRLGSIDARVPQGENWDAYLSHALSTNNVFMAILTPLYFNRSNCGKELGVFLLRSPHLGIDNNGALTHPENVLLIRWLPENAYAANANKDSLIPQILRLIEDTPADDGRDEDRTRAILRYRKKGMEKCVQVEPYYGELLDLFVARIRDMPKLPPCTEVGFSTATDAFKVDWKGRLGLPGGSAPTVSTAVGPLVPVVPRPLASVVVFYVTPRPITPDRNAVSFADSLIAETIGDTMGPRDLALDALLADVRAAGVAEGFTVFHAVANPVVPASPESLLSRLAFLSQSKVLSALVVEPTVWPSASAGARSNAVEQIVRSADWTGPVLLPTFGSYAVNVDELIATFGLPPRLVALPEAREPRVATLRRVLIDSRGQLLRAGSAVIPRAEQVPVLTGVSQKGS